jgi:hypothetical protein
LSELWTFDEDGGFKEPIKISGGLLVNFEEVSFMGIYQLNVEIPPALRPGGEAEEYGSYNRAVYKCAKLQ